MRKKLRFHGEFLSLWIRQNWPYLAAAFVILYFVYHLISGQHGLLAWKRLEEDLQKSQEIFKNIKTQEVSLERRINLLKNEIDPDLLEEQAGLRLNLHHPEDRVLLIPTSSKAEPFS